MNNKGNGEEKKIVQFPTLAERDRARKEKIRQEKEWQKQYKSERGPNEPFLKLGNIPPFTKIFTIVMVALNIPLLFMPMEKVHLINMFGFIPAQFSLPTIYTLVTHLLLHGDGMHLAFNSVMMLAIVTFFEKMQGTRRTIIFFTLCGIAGATTFFIFQPHSQMPMIGASGAMSGVFAAVIMAMHDQGRVFKLGKFTSRGPWPILGFWILLMIVLGIFGGDNIAWQAHVGGFIAGIILFYPLQKRWIKF